MTATPSSSVKPTGGLVRNCLGCLVLLFVGVPVLAVLGYGLDALVLAPWAYPAFDRPTLTGNWMGEFTVPSGMRFVLLLNLQHPFLTNTQPEPPGITGAVINGQGSWCSDRGAHGADIPLDGVVPLLAGFTAAADVVEINLRSAQYPQPGLQPAYFNGSWQAATLTLDSQMIFYDPQKKALVASTSDPDVRAPIKVVLKKSDEAAFHAACARLPGAAH